ncbi:hypothetical protein YTPLAS18_40520 [Nitrospira sp.]|nr:hypothetical protein YTPLAS18_40520 [Nitrospira sp.]
MKMTKADKFGQDHYIHLFESVLPEWRIDDTQHRLIFVVFSQAFSPMLSREEQLSAFRQMSWTDAEENAMLKWSSDGQRLFNELVELLQRTPDVDAAEAFLASRQVWPCLSVTETKEAIPKLLAQAFEGRGTYCDFWDYEAPGATIVQLLVGYHRPMDEGPLVM